MGKRILVTATTFPRWRNDAEPSFVFYLSNLLAKKGHKVTVLAPHHFNAKKYELMGNLRVYRFPYFYPNKLQKLCYDGGILENLKKSNFAKLQLLFLFLMELIFIRRIIKKEKIDIIHAHWILPQGILAAIYKKIFKIPYILTVHAGDIFPIKNTFFKLLSKIALKNCSYCTVNSSFTMKSVLDLFPVKKIEVIPMGVNIALFYRNKENYASKKKLNIEKEFILSVGRLVEKKGIEYLIMAMPFVLKKFPECRLVIIGHGPEKEKLRGLASKLNIDTNVIFAGKIKNKELPAYYSTADVFVGPSIMTKKGDTEGLGIVFLEALAAGTCVVGSNVGGIPDIIKDGKTGLLVKEKNPVQLADAIIKLLSDKKLRDKLAKQGHRYIKDKFSWDDVVERFDTLFEKTG